MRRVRLVLMGLVLFTVGYALRADHWPQFRGPGGKGLSKADEAKLPTEWSTSKNLKWKLKIPGKAWSQPIVWGDKTFVTTAVPEGEAPRAAVREQRQPRGRGRGGRSGRGGTRTPPDVVYRWEVYCIATETGKVVWKRIAHKAKPRLSTHRSNTFASETPVTDGEHVYVYFGMTGLFCYDFDGQLVWKKDLGNFPIQAGWGTSSSPVLLGEHLYLQIDNEKDSFLVALDKANGKEVWRVQRDERSTWSTPILWHNEKRTELVAGGKHVRSYDPKTGKLLWQLSMAGGRSSASAVADGEKLYVGNELRNRGGDDDGGGILFAVKAGATGDITPDKGETTSEWVAWSRKGAAPSMASPVVYRGHIYILDRRQGMVSSYATKTGEPAYERQRLGSGAFWASPWAYDGKVFCPADDGTTFVLEAGPTFKVLAKNRIDDTFWASAALAGDALLLRGVEYLYCVGEE